MAEGRPNPCSYPGCDSDPERVRPCSTEDCEGHLHHFCFTQVCHGNAIPDPPDNDALCFLCCARQHPGVFEGAAADEVPASVEAEDE